MPFPALGLAAGAGALFGSLSGGLMNWGFANKSAQNYKSSVRHLRRREYQDMMFSMKKAGLNPILASGATPGHSAAAMMQAPQFDIAGSFQKGVSGASEAAQTGGKVAKLEAERGHSAAQASRTKGLETNDQLARGAITSGIEKTQAETGTAKAVEALKRQEIEESKARTKNLDAERPNIESGFGGGMPRGILRLLERAGTSARELWEQGGMPDGRAEQPYDDFLGGK